jgi:hypothetical protein
MAGLDRPVFYTVLARGWTSAAGLVTVFLIARFLSAAEQGYYYTFASLIALQIVFELGFSFVVMQLASHESAHLVISASGEISGDQLSHARLASVLQKSVRWYAVGALVLAATLIPTGLYFFSSHQQLGDTVHWQIPWIAAAIATVCAFQLDPLFSFLEGCGFVAKVAHMRWLQAILSSVLAWTALALHHGLYAPAMAIAGQVIVGAIWLFGRRRLLAHLLAYDTAGRHISWRTEIWPFQWRVAISWSASYLISQTFTPFLFVAQGPVVAGKMGMSLSFANSLLAVAMSWVSTKAAPFGTLIAQKRFQELDTLFFRALRQSTALCALGSLAVWLTTTSLYVNHVGFADKLLAPLPFGLLLVATVGNNIGGAGGTYLRAHKQEKLVVFSSSFALLVVISNYFFSRRSGALGMVAAYFVILVFFNLGVGSYLFNKYRRLWHTSEMEPVATNNRAH